MKRILALFLILTMTMGLFGCAKAPEDVETDDSDASSTEQTEPEPEPEPEPITVAVCMGSINHPVHRIVQTGFMLKAEELGMNGVISGLDEGSIQELIATWERAVLNGAKGVLIWTGDDSCYDMMKSMKTSGVYVTVPHFEHEYMETKSFIDKNIYAPGYENGREVADFIVNKLQEKGITKGSIGITQNGPGVTQNASKQGFVARMEELKTNYIILGTIFEGAEITEATNKVTGYINGNPDMVAIFGTTGGSPQCFSNAIENTGRTDLITVGMDYTSLNMDAVENGYVTAIVCLPLFDEGAACAQALYDLNNGAVFNTSEDTWFEELDAPIATKEDMPYYRDIWQKMYDYFGLE